MESCGKATAPESQPPVCCAFPAVLLRSGSWLTPTRGDPDCHVTERSWLGKGERVISRARSINWGGSGACVRLDKKALKAQRFAAQHPTPGSRFTAYEWGSEVIALPRAMRCSREGRPGTGEQVVGRGRKTRGFSRGLEFEIRSDAHAPPKRGARCRWRQGPVFIVSARSLGLVCSVKA